MKSALLLILLIIPACALEIQVSGECVNEKVIISTDQPSFLVLRMNYGVPIYASTLEGPVTFVPKITGDLLITAISEKEEARKIVGIRECKPFRYPEISQNILPDGSFEEQGKRISWRTAYGALKKACEMLGYPCSSKLTDWGIFVDCIRGVCTGSLGKTSGWMYWVNYPNKPMPGISATEYRVYPNDEVLWYFSRSMDEKPESSPYSIKIRIGPNYEIHVNVKWEEKIPPIADFEFSPANPYVGQEVVFNASKSFAFGGKRIVEYVWQIDWIELKGEVVTYKFEKEGDYEIKLTVYDEEGLYSSVTKTLRVSRAEDYGNFTVMGEKLIDFGFVVLKIRAENAQVSIRNESCRVPYYDVKVCFSLWSNASISAVLVGNESFEVLDLSADRWVVVRESGRFTANISTGKFAILTPWKDFPLDERDERIIKALKYLRSLQRDDGGFGEEKSLFSATCWAIMAIVSANENPEEWKKNGKSPLDFLKENIKEEIARMGTADIARTILALVYAGEDPRNFEGYDLVKMLQERVRENGQIGDYVYTTIWAALALRSAGEDVSKSVGWIKSVQNPDGGFPWIEGEKSDCDDTSAAIQLLMLAKEYEAVDGAIEFVRTCQNPDGGIKYFGESASNSASDSWAIQALVSAGENPMNFSRNNISVVQHLISLQTPEGYFKYTAYEVSNPGYMTTSAIMALLGKYHPIKSLPVYRFSLAVENEKTIRLPKEIFYETRIDELTLITGKAANLTVSVERLKDVPEKLKLENAIAYISITVMPSNVSGYIKFAVPRDSYGSYVLMKFDGSDWIRLETDFIGSDDSYNYYKAYTQSFSLFAITEEREMIPTATPQITSLPGEVETTKTAEKPSKEVAEHAPVEVAVAVVIGIVIAACVAVALWLRR